MIDQPIRLILADDHDLVRAGIRNALKELAMIEIVCEVGDGADLMKALAEFEADFLILDVNMPGFEPLTEIHNICRRYPNLRILIVSAYDDYIYVQGLLSAGADGYHLKDQPLSDLKLAIERILSGERWLSSSLVEKLLQQKNEPQISKAPLSKRQIEIAHCLAQGLSNREIGLRLHVSVKTVENHLTRLYTQLNVANRLEALAYLHDHPEFLMHVGPVTQQDLTIFEDCLPDERTTLLIVDDNKRYRKQLGHLMEKAHPNSTIHEAGSLQETLSILSRIAPQVIFVDVVLGNEDGIRCTRRLRQEIPEARIVLISAYPDREFHRRGLEAGAAAFIDKKDLDIATLQQIINDAL